MVNATLVVMLSLTPMAANAQSLGTITSPQNPVVGPGGTEQDPTRAQTATAETAVQIIIPLRVNALTPLNFGRFAPSGVNGTIRISVDGARTAQNVIVGNTVGASALIDVIGPAGATVNFTLPTQLILNRQNGPGQMVLRPLSLAQSVRIGEQGVSQVGLGGILEVAGGQTTGLYAGEFAVTFTYQ
jgi:Domain of unknown function (DUF4402)